MEQKILELNELTAISSIDGRYGNKTQRLRNYFSEFSLIKYRMVVEIRYFEKLIKTLPELSRFNDVYSGLDIIIQNFSLSDAQKVKDIEKTTNHDVKAVEYRLRGYIDSSGINKYKEFIHFGLTSYDINSCAVNMMIRDSIIDVVIPDLESMINDIELFSQKHISIPMLAHTHGQPASPTKMGKEIGVFVYRLKKQLKQLKEYKFEAKFGGATGNFNAHYAAYPQIDWHAWADGFLEESLNLSRQEVTTQIESYDNLAELFDILKRINTIFIDMSRDMWTYISMGYFTQKVKKDEVGSSAMPHKVNPIDFENAEGNAGIAIALFEFISTKLPVSRLQRDLSGSTVERTIGVPIAHFLIAISSIKRGFGKLEVNVHKIYKDLENNWAVIAEGIQTILRKEGYPDPYKALKELTRKGENELITKDLIHRWIDTLNVSNEIKIKLKNLTPFNYVGVAKI
jgi:adenylosuccinate lyase